MKKVKNLMIGGLVLTASFVLVSSIKRRNKQIEETVEKEEEIERKYIDLSDQLNNIKKENEELKEELDEEKRYVKLR